VISPIAISTVHGKNLAVMLASIREYCPEIPVYLRGPASVLDRFDADVKVIGSPRNFGEDYNDIINCALKDFDSVVVANDDIVLTPSSYKVLLEDVEIVSDMKLNPGWVASRCDWARAWICADAFTKCPFPPLNWYSDDVQCNDLREVGYKNFVSASYVHHVGSQTVGVDANALTNQAMPWLMKNRPQYAKRWFNS